MQIMQTIKLSGISKRFGNVLALDNVDLECEPGQRLVIIGGSGAGKTTLLRILAGLEMPDQGGVFCGEVNITSMSPHLRGISMLSQDYAIYPHLTVERNLVAALEPLRLSAVERRERVEEILGCFELSSLRDRRPAQLSGGQMQRAALAKALVRRPQLIVLDEPLSQLDPALREQSRRWILSLTERFATSLIMVTHDSMDALRIADRLAVLDTGKVVQMDSPQSVYRRPVNRAVAEMLSPLGINELDCNAATSNELRVNSADQSQACCFRPESAQLTTLPIGVDASCLDFCGVLRHMQFLGFASLASVEVRFADRVFSIKALVSDPPLPPEQPQIGQSVYVRVQKSELLALNVASL